MIDPAFDSFPQGQPREPRGSRFIRFWHRELARTAATFVVAVTVGTTMADAQSTMDLDELAGSTGILRFESEPHTGDLDVIRQRQHIRVLVSYDRTCFFIVDGQARGYEYELTKAFGKFLNSQDRHGSHIRMVYVPVPFDQLIPALRHGHGDIIAAGMTVTPARSDVVQFSEPYLPAVDEIVVANKNVKGLNTIDDLSGRDVMLVAGSSYVPHVRALSEDLVRRGKAPIGVSIAPSEFEAEDILDLVNAGIVDLTIVDNHVGEIWSEVMPNVVTYPDLTVSRGGKIAWAVRKDNPQLLASVNAFLSKNRRGTTLGNILFSRYYEGLEWVTNPIDPDNSELLGQYVPLFKEFAARYGFDWQLIAALAYQESWLDQDKRSDRGAVGLMQIKPTTARSPEVGIRDVTTARNNVHAGVKYLASLRDRYFSNSSIDPAARTRLSLAAYNAGPANIDEMRKIAKKEKRNPDKWFGHVADVTLRHIGWQPVDYVANINKYYFAYKLANEELARRGEELDALEGEAPDN